MLIFMPTNLELKIELNSIKRIKKILREIEAEHRGTLIQKDVYYSVPNGLLKLRIENGQESLIYYNRNENRKDRWSDFDYLKFSEPGGEYFFKKLFRIEIVVHKKRELYYFDDTRIHLDNVKSLGNFLELETLVVNGKTDAQIRFKKIIELLNLNTENQIRKSYRDLLLESKK